MADTLIREGSPPAGSAASPVPQVYDAVGNQWLRWGCNKTALQTNAAAVGTGSPANVGGMAGARFYVSGITTATITFEYSGDGSTWHTLTVYDETGATRTSVSANGVYVADVSGMYQVRANITAWTAGNVNVIALTAVAAVVTHVGQLAIADGGSTTLGSKGDAAVTDPTLSATEMSVLKGLLKQLQGTSGTISPVQLSGASVADGEAIPVIPIGDVGTQEPTTLTVGTDQVTHTFANSHRRVRIQSETNHFGLMIGINGGTVTTFPPGGDLEFVATGITDLALRTVVGVANLTIVGM